MELNCKQSVSQGTQSSLQEFARDHARPNRTKIRRQREGKDGQGIPQADTQRRRRKNVCAVRRNLSALKERRLVTFRNRKNANHMKQNQDIWGGFTARIQLAVEKDNNHCDVEVRHCVEIGSESSKEFCVVFDCYPKDFSSPIRRVTHVVFGKDLSVCLKNGIIAGVALSDRK